MLAPSRRLEGRRAASPLLRSRTPPGSRGLLQGIRPSQAALPLAPGATYRTIGAPSAAHAGPTQILEQRSPSNPSPSKPGLSDHDARAAGCLQTHRWWWLKISPYFGRTGGPALLLTTWHVLPHNSAYLTGWIDCFEGRPIRATKSRIWNIPNLSSRNTLHSAGAPWIGGPE
jgi:hypothetical protein